jgi:hypothetical protein
MGKFRIYNVFINYKLTLPVNESSIWFLGQVPMVINSTFDIVRIGQGLIASSPILYGSLVMIVLFFFRHEQSDFESGR